MGPAMNRAVKVARTLHIYLALFALGLVVLFGLTGFLLNHGWEGKDDKEKVDGGNLPKELLEPPDRAKIIAEVGRRFELEGEPAGYEERKKEIRVRYEWFGGKASIKVRRSDGRARMSLKRRGFFNALSDIHMGKKSGGVVGSLVVDGGGIVLILLSLTGLLLWVPQTRRRRLGAATLAAGLLAFLLFFVVVF